ncbi:hypothetical protein QBC47DRAFT_416759 [Echria macrotheca]|uniref:Calcium-transporting ATPase n=1 Tax=Echria macrotheca TaxID=438768 RepID=A0AAJ0B6U2_9PEZI|nr:hypothetical protein QBC47DRAFT_416759 [Echria macrotheca]
MDIGSRDLELLPEAPSTAHDRSPLEPNPGEEHLFEVENNPFAFSPGQLTKLLDPKSLPALQALGGLSGLERGLRTNCRSGLSIDETLLSGTVSFQDATSGTPTGSHPPLPLPEQNNTHYVDRKRVFGEHKLPERKPKSFLKLAWIALQDPVLILLCVAAFVSLALGLYQTIGPLHGSSARVEWVEGATIVVVIMIIVVVGALTEWEKEKHFRKLNKKKEDRLVKVIRSGKPSSISVYDILVGDVLILEQGNVIPVDGVLVEGHAVSCDEASATGESDLVKKTTADAVLRAWSTGDANPDKLDPFLLSGTKVLDGFGTFLVTAVGPYSSHGRIMLALRAEPGMTPLQTKLNTLAASIAKLGVAAGLLLFAVLFSKFLVRLPNNSSLPVAKAHDFFKILISSMAIIVVAVPEGLPLAVTLTLFFATRKMTKESNLVRHLQSCETMGNVTTICSDKTGTLTENVMTVVGGTLGDGIVEVDHNPFSDPPTPGKTQVVWTSEPSTVLSPDFQELIRLSIAINTTAFESDDNKGGSAFVGTKTETALLDWARRCFAMRPLSVERANHGVVQLFPFDSRQKCMATVIRLRDGRYRLLVKGAPEVVLAHCNRVVKDPTTGITPIPLYPAGRDDISGTVARYASRSLRTLALAYRDFEIWPVNEDHQGQAEVSEVLGNLVWLGVVAIQDPVRKGVRAAVETCRRASVAVKMVTGDNVETAMAIAEECGILVEDGSGLVMEGPEFRRLTERLMRSIVSNLCVLARSSPEDKRLLVKALQSRGELVAVTGDGTNDAPALMAADVGFSMGITGTEVAKEASDIVLMDDNFSSILNALAWGRAINDSVKKFLQFQITVNITAMVLTFVSAVASAEERPVLNAVQLLWVNLIMDAFAALALATDPPTESLFDRAPEPRTAALIDLTMWKMIVGQSIYQLIVTLSWYLVGPQYLQYPQLEHQTLIFNVFVFMQIFTLFNSRRIDNKLNIFEGLHKNKLFMLMMTMMVVGQVTIIFIGGAAFGVTRLNGRQWAVSLLIGFLSILVGILIRMFPDSCIGAMINLIPIPARLRRNDSRAPAAVEL